jgi:hypothetical protein
MADCRVGPRYCPMCGTEMRNNASICISCLSKLKIGKNKPANLNEVKQDYKSFYKNRDSNKIRLFIGFLICFLTLPHIVITSLIGYYPSLYYLLQFLNPVQLLIAIPAYIVGLGLYHLKH